MKRYRLYFLDGEGRIARVVEENFDADAAAIRWAGAQPHDHAKELWRGGRIVLCFTASGRSWSPTLG